MADEKKARSNKPCNNLTVEFVRSTVHYDPETGWMTWLVNRPPRGKVGGVAGFYRKDGYYVITFGGKHYLGHRIAYLIMEGEWPKDGIDHKDGNRPNMKWENLRPASHIQNLHNRPVQRNSLSGVKGVSSSRNGKRWNVRITVAGKTHRLGPFDSLAEAIDVQKKAAVDLVGEFAHLK